MRQLVEENVLIERISYTREEAIKRLQEDKLSSNNSQLLRYKDSCMTHIYRCGWLQDYYYGYMVPSTGYLKVFSLHLYNHGIVLLGPSEKNPNKDGALAQSFERRTIGFAYSAFGRPFGKYRTQQQRSESGYSPDRASRPSNATSAQP